MTLEQIQSKLDVLKANLAKLDEIPQSSLAEFQSDIRNLSATIHLLLEELERAD